MTRLEQEIKEALEASEHGMTSDYFDKWSKYAAVVARCYIEKAWDAGQQVVLLHEYNRKKRKKEWLKENGITE